MSDLGDKLWNAAVSGRDFADPGDRYHAVVLEQYKLCVEMADRVSARRSSTNTYFLSLNSALAAALVAVAGGRLAGTSAWVLAAALVILLAQCAAWFVIVRSYRQLNFAKWAVIGAFEQKLPAFAYSRAEWELLGEGRDWRRYLPFTHVEKWVPVIFATAYVTGFVALIS